MKIETNNSISPIRGRTVFDVIYQAVSGLFYLIMIPFKWSAKGLAIIREDNEKIASFRRWHKRQKIIAKRQRKLNDEF